MDTVNVTRCFVGLLVFSLLAIAAWDIYLAISKIQSDTPSDMILTFLQRYPVVAAAIGVIIGHLLWPQHR